MLCGADMRDVSQGLRREEPGSHGVDNYHRYRLQAIRVRPADSWSTCVYIFLPLFAFDGTMELTSRIILCSWKLWKGSCASR